MTTTIRPISHVNQGDRSWLGDGAAVIGELAGWMGAAGVAGATSSVAEVGAEAALTVGKKICWIAVPSDLTPAGSVK